MGRIRSIIPKGPDHSDALIDACLAFFPEYFESCPSLTQVVETLSSRSVKFLGGELKQTADETLFLELALRGYDLSKLREEPTTAEILKIS